MTLYKLYETLSNFTIGSWLSVFIIVSLFIEITPIKINPVGWLGKHLSASMYTRVNTIEQKLDEHIAQSYRNKILSFQDLLLTQGRSSFTKEQYDEVIEAINSYENYCQENKLTNDKCTLAIKYIKRCYTECQNTRSFSSLPVVPQ